MKPFKHYNAQSLKKAATLLKEYNGKAKVNAGGTDILSAMRDKSLPEYPEALINIKTIKGLEYIRKDKKGLTIGALTKLADIAESPDVKEEFKLLAEAVHSVATPQIRNVATIGGNLAQDVRCWYYRYPAQIGGPIVCLRKGGKICNALAGDNRYHSIFGAAPMNKYPCSSHCPAHINIPSYMEKVRNNDFAAAAHILLDSNPMPAITGRVCPVFCEPECNRNAFDEPVAIRCVERTVGDYVLEHGEDFFLPPETESGKKITIIGSGPAGLTAAFYLRRSGHKVIVYERLPHAGGMLRNSIPAYRLPKEVVTKQIRGLENMGIKFETGVNVGKDILIDDLTEGCDAVFLATGAWKEKLVGIEDEGLAISGLDFLNKVNAGNRDIPGQKVAVIGGGNVAMDVARTLLRLGSEPTIIYRRTKNEMPALKDEVEKAIEEGILFEFLTLPTAASKANGRINLTCRRMRLGAPDESGRLRPLPVEGSDFTDTFDAVIKAIGEEPDASFLPAGIKHDLSEIASPVQLGEKLFAGGDFITGPSTVVQAVAAGKAAANLIDAFFGVILPSSHEDGKTTNFVHSSFLEIPRARDIELPVSQRTGNIDVEDVSGLPQEDIEKEAKRCFNCGCLAVAPSDIASALIALDARIITTKKGLSAENFFKTTATDSTLLETDELIKEIWIPKPQAGTAQHFRKFTLREPVDFAIVSVASALTIKNNVCSDARIVLGAVAPEPIRARLAEEFLKGKRIDEETAVETARLALEGAKQLSGNAHKVTIAKTLVKRVILS